MVTGHVLFRGSPAEVMYQHQHAPLPLEQLESVPQPVVSLIEVLLDKDPKRRFQTPGRPSEGVANDNGRYRRRPNYHLSEIGADARRKFLFCYSEAAGKTGTGEDFSSKIAHHRERFVWSRGGYRFPG
jgi:hypothetical protein